MDDLWYFKGGRLFVLSIVGLRKEVLREMHVPNGQNILCKSRPLLLLSRDYFLLRWKRMWRHTSRPIYISARQTQRGERKQITSTFAIQNKPLEEFFYMYLISRFLKRPRHEFRYGSRWLILEVHSFSAPTKAMRDKSTTMMAIPKATTQVGAENLLNRPFPYASPPLQKCSRPSTCLCPSFS